jgi:hypothetical protein
LKNLSYGDAATIKIILEIPTAETKYAAEIASCITSADALVDGKLSKIGLTVPSATPQNVIDAADYYCAWVFRHRRDPTGAEAFWSEAEKFLNAYIESTQTSKDLPIALGQDTS